MNSENWPIEILMAGMESINSTSDNIKKAFEQNFDIVVNKKIAQEIRYYCFRFETRGNNPEALNTPFLGVTKIFFISKDQDEFFDIFNVEERQIKNMRLDSFIVGLSSSEVRKMLNKLDSVDTNRKVQSDPFNVFITFILYKVANCKDLTENERENTKIALIKILQYKFFTSLVNHRFGYGSDPAIMQATIASLNNKYAIAVHGTWKKVMEIRAEELVAKTSIHYQTILNYNNDLGIFYLITDIQTRIRNQINIIVTKYYERKEDDDKITSYGLAGNDIDGEKVIVSNSSTLDSMTSNLSAEILSIYQFLDNELIKLTCRLFSGLREDMFKKVLIKFSELALEQQKANTLEEIYLLKKQKIEIYRGCVILIKNIIQKTYRHCSKNGVNLKAKLDILTCAKDIFSSSRILDEDILQVRNSIGYFIDTCDLTKREATKASLRIAFALYILIKSFKYI